MNAAQTSLNTIRQGIRKDDHKLVSLFNKAVASFNTTAPRHFVLEINQDKESFSIICKKLENCTTLSDIPKELKEQMKECLHVDIGMREYFAPHMVTADLFPLFENVREICVTTASRNFFEKTFTSAIAKIPRLESIDASRSKIQDKDLKKLANTKIRNLNLAKTSISNSCLGSDALKTVQKLDAKRLLVMLLHTSHAQTYKSSMLARLTSTGIPSRAMS